MPRKFYDQDTYLDVLLRLQEKCRHRKQPFKLHISAAVLLCLDHLGDEDAPSELAAIIAENPEFLEWAKRHRCPVDERVDVKAKVDAAVVDAMAPSKLKRGRQMKDTVDRIVQRVREFFDAHPNASWQDAYEGVENHYRDRKKFTMAVRNAAVNRGVKLR